MQDAGPVIGFFVVILIIGGVIAIVVAASAARAKELNETYAALARRFRGNFFEGTWFKRPSVTFDHGSTWVRVDIHSTGGKNPVHYTQVHIGWPEPGFRMEVYPDGFFTRIGKFLGGMEDVEIGSPDFDRDYVITTNSYNLLLESLTPEVQTVIDSLRKLGDNSQVYVAVRNYELLVKKQGLIDDLGTLVQLIEHAQQIYDAALVGQSKGIQILEVKTHTPTLTMGDSADDIICQVCGDSITSDVVFCRSCQTPHHQDCWKYYGQCSTFGCGQRSYRRRKSKQSKRRK